MDDSKMHIASWTAEETCRGLCIGRYFAQAWASGEWLAAGPGLFLADGVANSKDFDGAEAAAEAAIREHAELRSVRE